jgi:hypothetical protein
MVRLLRSFLVRWWVLDDGSARIELTHIQSDARVVATSVSEAIAWINLIAEADAGHIDESDTLDDAGPPSSHDET